MPLDSGLATGRLIARGAALDARDWRGRSPLDLAEAGNGEALARTIRAEINLRHGQRAKAVKVLPTYMGRFVLPLTFFK